MTSGAEFDRPEAEIVRPAEGDSRGRPGIISLPESEDDVQEIHKKYLTVFGKADMHALMSVYSPPEESPPLATAMRMAIIQEYVLNKFGVLRDNKHRLSPHSILILGLISPYKSDLELVIRGFRLSNLRNDDSDFRRAYSNLHPDKLVGLTYDRKHFLSTRGLTLYQELWPHLYSHYEQSRQSK